MRFPFRIAIAITLVVTPVFGQTKRLWVLNGTGGMVEYDSATFTPKQTVKAPPALAKSPGAVEVNRVGQILFEPPLSLPLSDEDAAATHQVRAGDQPWVGTAGALQGLRYTRRIPANPSGVGAENLTH